MKNSSKSELEWAELQHEIIATIDTDDDAAEAAVAFDLGPDGHRHYGVLGMTMTERLGLWGEVSQEMMMPMMRRICSWQNAKVD